MWKNDGNNRLYCVKRANVEEYHCGSFSHATPKLYTIGHAKSAMKQLNKRLKSHLEALEKNSASEPDRLEKYKAHLEEKGYWIIGEVQLCASEISYDWTK